MDGLPTTARRIFKRLRLGELSLVDEACVPGSDVEIVKRKFAPSPDDRESRKTSVQEDGHGSPGGGASELELVEKALTPYHGLLAQLHNSTISVPDFLTRAEAEASRLQAEAETGGDPVAKSAAQHALSIVTESTVNLAELTAAYNALNTRVETVTAEGEVAKSRATAAEAKVVELTAALAAKDEEIAKAKPAKSQAEQDEEVLKSLPAHLRDTITKAREATDKAELDGEVAKAKTLGIADPDAVGKAMQALRKADPASTEVVEKALKSAAALGSASASIFKAHGVNTDTVNEDPIAELNAKADVIAKAKNIDTASAFAEACEANPALYDQYIAKRRAGVVQ